MWIKVISQIHSSCVLSLVVLSFAFLKTVTICPLFINYSTIRIIS